MNTDLSALYLMADSAIEVVSFDFFDTLFSRPVCDAEDVFDYVGLKCGIESFKEMRRHAQILGFQKMHREGRREINIDDIYDCISLDSEVARKVKKIEIEAELRLTLPNPEMIEFLKFCKGTKKVIIISDMYLYQDYFQELLKRNSIDVDHVFVSCELNATKRDSGEIFDLVRQRMGVAASKILHVGDSLQSDVVRASEKGYKTFHYQEQGKPERKLDQPFASSLASALHRVQENKPSDKFYAYGFRFGGPAVVAFADYITDQAAADGIDKLLFVSRDGYILHKLGTGRLGIASDYFRGSRTAFNLAAVTEENFEDFLPFFLSGAEGLSPHELFERIGVSPASDKVLSDLGLGRSVLINQQNIAEVTALVSACRSQILMKCREVRRGLFGYLHALGVKNGMRLALVDVGWAGTTLDAFQRALKGMYDVDLFGYFLCLTDTPEVHERRRRLHMKSLIDTANFPAETISEIYRNRVAAELMFSAPHPSVIGYSMNSAGKVQTVEDIGRARTVVFNEATKRMLAGMEDYFIAYHDIVASLEFDASSLHVVAPFVDFLSRMPEEVASEFSTIKNFDAWGSSKNFDLRASDYM